MCLESTCRMHPTPPIALSIGANGKETSKHGAPTLLK